MNNKSKELKVKVLLLITGSIAAVRIPLLVSQLVKDNYEIKCVVSENAEKLIQPLSLSILSRNTCILDKDQWSYLHSRPLHIDLCDWADVLIMAPLTATTLSKWVTGNADGLISSILIANNKPIIVAPAMNSKMWSNKAVQRNYIYLKDYPNVLILKPSKGILACDEIGVGKIPPNDLIQLALKFLLLQNKKPYYRDLLNKEFLITGGCTSEKIDAARKITNNSSGTMGLMLAQVARFRGAKVKYIHGPLKNKLDITFANEQEITSLIEAKNFDEVINFSKQLNKLVVVTRGEKGAVAVNGGEIVESDIHKNLKIVDLTGAGDLFAAGFLHGYINKLSNKECLEKGTEMSSKIIQQIGARL